MIDKDLLVAALSIEAVPELVIADGSFVAAEFFLVGITVSSLDWRAGLDPAAVRLGADPSHVTAVAMAFIMITMLHTVLGELAPKSLALQRTGRTALAIVRPLGIFLALSRPASVVLNGLGNWVQRLGGLQAGTGEEHLRSTEELKLLMAASQDAGLLDPAQQLVVEHTFNRGEWRARDILTLRPDLFWIDADDPPDAVLRATRSTRHLRSLPANHRPMARMKSAPDNRNSFWRIPCPTIS